ncbi:MAG: alpha/beta fold hydrolase, partial [Pseudomonadota bacterium]
WAPDETQDGGPRAIILALHGFGDYAPLTFDGPGGYWADRGFVVYAYDQRGFGRNESRGRWPGADALIADARAAAAAARAAHPGLPLFLLGHSMGGGVALAAAAVGDPPENQPGDPGGIADGLILAAPAVWGGDRLALPYRAAAWGGALLFPEKRWTGEGVVRIQASDNIEALRALGRDQLYLHRPSSREFMGLIRLMDRAVDAAPKVTVPTLTLYGEKDEVTPKEPIKAAHDAIPAEKTMILYENGWHLLFRDLQREVVWADVANWIETRL